METERRLEVRSWLGRKAWVGIASWKCFRGRQAWWFSKLETQCLWSCTLKILKMASFMWYFYFNVFFYLHINANLKSYEKGRGRFRHRDRHAWREDYVWWPKERTVIYKPRRDTWNRLSLGALQGTNATDTLISDIWPPQLWEKKFLLFKLCSLWFFITASLEN
jgi:hypothetical protein